MLKKRGWRLLCIAIFALVLPARADDWPHWRGIHRDGHSAESSRYESGWTFPEKIVWQADVGHGGSSPVVASGRAYFLGWKQDRELVTCLDLRTGKQLWRQEYPAPQYARNATGDEGLYDGPSGTPELDLPAGLLFTLGTDGELRAWDIKHEGQLVWRRNLYDDYAMPRRPKIGRSGRRDYGYTTSPLAYGDWLLVEAGAADGAVIAFDKGAGQPLWKSEHRGLAGHSGGFALVEREGTAWAAIQTLNHALAFSLDKRNPGKTLAAIPWTTEFANSIASVVAHEDSLLITSAYNHNKIARYKLAGDGAKLVWEQPFASKICTPIIHAGRVYWVWEKAHCLDWDTGKSLWSGGQFGQAGSCILTGDERLLAWSNRGKLSLIETAGRSPDRFVELAATPNLFSSDVWPHLVLADGHLLCRDRLGHVKCLSLRP